MMTRKTKKERFIEIIAALDEDKVDLIEFCEREIEAIDKKAERAKKRAAERKKEADPPQMLLQRYSQTIRENL